MSKFALFSCSCECYSNWLILKCY